MFYYIRLTYILTIIISLPIYYSIWYRSNKECKEIKNNIIGLFILVFSLVPVANTLFFLTYLLTFLQKIEKAEPGANIDLLITDKEVYKNMSFRRHLEITASRNIVILFLLALPSAIIWSVNPSLISGGITLIITMVIIIYSKYNNDCLPEVKQMLHHRGYRLVKNGKNISFESDQDSLVLVNYYPKNKSLVAHLKKDD